jgi:TonB family protein
MPEVCPPQWKPKYPQDLDFSVGIKYSLLFHFALIATILTKGFVFPGKPMPIVPTLRVDIVGLPDILKKDLKGVPKTSSASDKLNEQLKKLEVEAKKIKVPAPIAEPAKPDEMVLKPKRLDSEKREQKLKNSLARIKALAKISGEMEKQSSGVLIKGNQISRGSSLSGEAKESAQISYYELVRERLQENWALPVWIARQKLSAQVQVFIDSQGRLRSYRFVKLSGNSQFDEAVKRTLQESQPFPLPPAELARSALSDGILVGFPL